MEKVMQVLKQVPALILRSPAHGLVSEGMLLLSVTGRKSGKRYTLPIYYLRDGDTVVMTTDSRWWKNLRGGAPVTLRIKGENMTGVGEAITDEATVADVLTRMVRRFGRYGKVIGVRRESNGEPNAEDLDRVKRERVVIQVKLDHAPGAE